MSAAPGSALLAVQKLALTRRLRLRGASKGRVLAFAATAARGLRRCDERRRRRDAVAYEVVEVPAVQERHDARHGERVMRQQEPEGCPPR